MEYTETQNAIILSFATLYYILVIKVNLTYRREVTTVEADIINSYSRKKKNNAQINFATPTNLVSKTPLL